MRWALHLKSVERSGSAQKLRRGRAAQNFALLTPPCMQPLAAVFKTAARMQCRPRREGKSAIGRTKAYESGEVQTVGRCGDFCLRNLELEVLRVRGSKAGVRQVREERERK